VLLYGAVDTYITPRTPGGKAPARNLFSDSKGFKEAREANFEVVVNTAPNEFVETR